MRLHGIAMPACDQAGHDGSWPANNGDRPEPAARPETTAASAAARLQESPVQHRPAGAQPGRWLAAAMAALAALATAAAVVSYSAQYRLVLTAKSAVLVAALEAAIPDVSALIFATLGIALALHGRRAVRARVLNLGAVATSIAMNVLAAGHGWRDLAVWVMPPVAYALASDTAIGVVRSWTLARQRELRDALADDAGATPLAALGGLALWLLRLALAPASTLAGFRRWVLDEGPVAPGRKAVDHPSVLLSLPAPAEPSRTAVSSAPLQRPANDQAPGTKPGTKTARFLALVVRRYGPLAALAPADVSRVCAELAPQVGLNTGAARTALRREVLAAREVSQP